MGYELKLISLILLTIMFSGCTNDTSAYSNTDYGEYDGNSDISNSIAETTASQYANKNNTSGNTKTYSPPKITNTPSIIKTTTTPKTTSGKCDPNYSGCVPIASDVDCAGGKGNGPAYVRGPVTVIGIDIYDLDRDGDGIGCE